VLVRAEDEEGVGRPQDLLEEQVGLVDARPVAKGQ
jgi:hypothetical protein